MMEKIFSVNSLSFFLFCKKLINFLIIQDDDMNGHKPMKGLFKEKKKIKKKKSLMAEKLSQLKNGTGKQKVKKEALKNKAKSGKKDKTNNKVLNLFKFFTVLGFFMFLESCLYKCVLVYTLEIVFY